MPYLYLDIGGLFTLKKASKKLSTNLLHAHETAIEITRFVHNLLTLCSLMSQHNDLIPGSFTTQFFENVLWKQSDLDIYIHGGEGASDFGNYICRMEKYALEERIISHCIYRRIVRVCLFLLAVLLLLFRTLIFTFPRRHIRLASQDLYLKFHNQLKTPYLAKYLKLD